ncbi:hypothetical protein HYU92_05055 [Candidatus Curtissbacteria bacterium]|nr:hypothetical protein [Candidatus Curtissbacteria bacterium]
MKYFLFLVTVVSLLALSITIVDINSQKSTHAKDANSNLVNPTIRKIATDIYQNCQEKESVCAENAITQNLLAKYPVPEILSSIYDYDTYFSCHAFTHFLGRALYQKLQSIPDVYSQIDFTCHGGTYHGTIESYLDQQKSSPQSLTGGEIKTICSDSKKLTNKNPGQVYTECLHGFGHAFMFITNSDLPQSLNYCDKMETIEDREKCYGGAFMENSTSSTNSDHKSAWTKPDDKFFPCTVLQEHYLNQCYFYQANYLIMISRRNYPSVFADCQMLNKQHRIHCILGIGASLASVSNEQGIEKAAKICSLGKDDTQVLCVGSAVSSLFARYGGETEKIMQFCSLAAENLKSPCFAKIGEYSRTWGKSNDELEKICSGAKVYKETCLESRTSPT